jgi:hypothetical protein
MNYCSDLDGTWLESTEYRRQLRSYFLVFPSVVILIDEIGNHQDRILVGASGKYTHTM